MNKNMIALGAALALAACVTPTSYGPERDGYGYSEQKIEADRYQVVFRGNSATRRETVEDYLLYRAAELTVAAGHDYFILLESATDRETRYQTSVDHTYLRASRHPYYRFPYYAYGFEWSAPYDRTVREISRYSAIAYVTMRKGAKPEDDVRAFTARDVLTNLRPVISPDDTAE